MKKTVFNRKNRKQLKNEISYLNWEIQNMRNEYTVHQKWHSKRINQLKIEYDSLAEQFINLEHDCMKDLTQLLLEKDQVLIESYKMESKAKFWKVWSYIWCFMTMVLMIIIVIITVTNLFI